MEKAGQDWLVSPTKLKHTHNYFRNCGYTIYSRVEYILTHWPIRTDSTLILLMFNWNPLIIYMSKCYVSGWVLITPHIGDILFSTSPLEPVHSGGAR